MISFTRRCYNTETFAKNDLFENVPVPTAAAKLAVPTMISSLVMVIYNLADTYYVGSLNDPIQTAGVALAAPALLAFNAVNNLFGVGASSTMSRALGKGDYKKTKHCAALGFYWSLICAVMFAILTSVFRIPLLRFLGADSDTLAATSGYMSWAVIYGAVPSILNVVLSYLVRAEGSSFHASVGTMCGCILNIVLDPVFIMPWGLHMGAAGAGLATFLSNCVACAYFAIFLFVKRKTTLVSVNFKFFRFDREIMKDILNVGVPAAIQNLLNVTGMTVFNNFASAYGSEVVAAMGIVQKIQMVPIQITLGASQGIMPFIGYNYAAKKRKRMRDAALYILRWMIPFLLIAAVVCIWLSEPIVEIFMKTESVVSYGSRFLIGFILALPFMCVDYTAVGVFQAIGAGRKSLIFAFLRKIAFEIPAIILLNTAFPIYGIAYSSMLAEIMMTILSARSLYAVLYGKEKKS